MYLLVFLFFSAFIRIAAAVAQKLTLETVTSDESTTTNILKNSGAEDNYGGLIAGFDNWESGVDEVLTVSALDQPTTAMKPMWNDVVSGAFGFVGADVTTSPSSGGNTTSGTGGGTTSQAGGGGSSNNEGGEAQIGTIRQYYDLYEIAGAVDNGRVRLYINGRFGVVRESAVSQLTAVCFSSSRDNAENAIGAVTAGFFPNSAIPQAYRDQIVYPRSGYRDQDPVSLPSGCRWLTVTLALTVEAAVADSLQVLVIGHEEGGSVIVNPGAELGISRAGWSIADGAALTGLYRYSHTEPLPGQVGTHVWRGPGAQEQWISLAHHQSDIERGLAILTVSGLIGGVEGDLDSWATITVSVHSSSSTSALGSIMLGPIEVAEETSLQLEVGQLENVDKRTRWARILLEASRTGFLDEVSVTLSTRPMTDAEKIAEELGQTTSNAMISDRGISLGIFLLFLVGGPTGHLVQDASLVLMGPCAPDWAKELGSHNAIYPPVGPAFIPFFPWDTFPHEIHQWTTLMVISALFLVIHGLIALCCAVPAKLCPYEEEPPMSKFDVAKARGEALEEAGDGHGDAATETSSVNGGKLTVTEKRKTVAGSCNVIPDAIYDDFCRDKEAAARKLSWKEPFLQGMQTARFPSWTWFVHFYTFAGITYESLGFFVPDPDSSGDDGGGSTKLICGGVGIFYSLLFTFFVHRCGVEAGRAPKLTTHTCNVLYHHFVHSYLKFPKCCRNFFACGYWRCRMVRVPARYSGVYDLYKLVQIGWVASMLMWRTILIALCSIGIQRKKGESAPDGVCYYLYLAAAAIFGLYGVVFGMGVRPCRKPFDNFLTGLLSILSCYMTLALLLPVLNTAYFSARTAYEVIIYVAFATLFINTIHNTVELVKWVPLEEEYLERIWKMKFLNEYLSRAATWEAENRPETPDTPEEPIGIKDIVIESLSDDEDDEESEDDDAGRSDGGSGGEKRGLLPKKKPKKKKKVTRKASLTAGKRAIPKVGAAPSDVSETADSDPEEPARRKKKKKKKKKEKKKQVVQVPLKPRHVHKAFETYLPLAPVVIDIAKGDDANDKPKEENENVQEVMLALEDQLDEFQLMIRKQEKMSDVKTTYGDFERKRKLQLEEYRKTLIEKNEKAKEEELHKDKYEPEKLNPDPAPYFDLPPRIAGLPGRKPGAPQAAAVAQAPDPNLMIMLSKLTENLAANQAKTTEVMVQKLTQLNNALPNIPAALAQPQPDAPRRLSVEPPAPAPPPQPAVPFNPLLEARLKVQADKAREEAEKTRLENERLRHEAEARQRKLDQEMEAERMKQMQKIRQEMADVQLQAEMARLAQAKEDMIRKAAEPPPPMPVQMPMPMPMQMPMPMPMPQQRPVEAPVRREPEVPQIHCSFLRDELQDYLKQSNFGKDAQMFSAYFKRRQKDGPPLCVVCSKPIGAHPADTRPRAATPPKHHLVSNMPGGFDAIKSGYQKKFAADDEDKSDKGIPRFVPPSEEELQQEINAALACGEWKIHHRDGHPVFREEDTGDEVDNLAFELVERRREAYYDNLETSSTSRALSLTVRSQSARSTRSTLHPMSVLSLSCLSPTNRDAVFEMTKRERIERERRERGGVLSAHDVTKMQENIVLHVYHEEKQKPQMLGTNEWILQDLDESKHSDDSI